MTTPIRRRKPADPAKRRRDNQAAIWKQRYDQAQDDHAALAAVAFDRARAAALRGERTGLAPQALYELAQLCHEFAERLERAQEARRGRSP